MNFITSPIRADARGYVRVSTQYQEDGQSIETQVKRIQSHCDYKGLNLTKIYTDSGISGKNMNRPALQELMKDMTKGSYVIISDLSRLSRNTKDALNMLEEFKTRGVYFVCLSPDMQFDANPISELIFTILMAVHKLERENVSKHVSMNMQRLSKEEKLRSRPPFGWKFTGKENDMEEVPEQQAVRNKIIELHKQGNTYSKIAQILNSNGDNSVLSLNKRDNSKVCIFYAQTVKSCLIDAGVVEGKGSYQDRKPIQKRIVSHHKKD